MTCTNKCGDRCTLGLYGGTPSDGVCSICDSYDGPARGAGDVVHAALSVMGVVKVMHFVFDECGCAARRAALNAAMPIGGER